MLVLSGSPRARIARVAARRGVVEKRDGTKAARAGLAATPTRSRSATSSLLWEAEETAQAAAASGRLLAAAWPPIVASGLWCRVVVH